MNNNVLQVLSNTLYQIYNTEDFLEMKKQVLRSLKYLIPCECVTVCTYLTREENGEQVEYLGDPIAYPEEFVEIEEIYMTIADRSFSRWIVQRRHATVSRATALMSDEEREKTEVFVKTFKPYGLYYGLYLTVVHNAEFLACISIYRKKEDGDFTEDDAFILQALSEHLNIRFYNQRHGHPLTENPYELERKFTDYDLTAREAEILSLIINKKDNEEIADMLCISNNTLKKHLQNIYRKTEVANRLQLMKLFN